jgi:thiamine kinase-like enzyme
VSGGGDSGLGPDLLERVTVLAGRPRTVDALPGGLTNRNYKISTPEGTYVLRHSNPSTSDELAVDRVAEYENSVRAAAAGVGAPVVQFLPDDGVLVIGFLEGETLSDELLQRPSTLRRVADACRRLHAGEPFVNRFDMFEVQAEYLARVQRRGFRLPAGYLDHAEAVARIRAALAVHPVGLVPCNNDTLAANFIDDSLAVWIIDYEYSGNNDPYFELGNLWSECHLSLEQLEELVTAYDGRSSRSHLARARLWGLMSQYGWTLWASIQDGTSPLDFDFWTWGMEKYDRAEATFGSPELERLLADVTRED